MIVIGRNVPRLSNQTQKNLCFGNGTPPDLPPRGPACLCGDMDAAGTELGEDLVDAICRGDEGAVRAWLDGNGRVNSTLGGGTALMFAASHGHERLVNILVQAGANITHQDTDGDTALMSAADNGHEKVADLLIRHGADADQQNCCGGTALMIAAQHSHLAVVRRLLQAGADTQKLDSEGRSVMQLAAGPTLTAVMEAETDARLAELETLEATCSSSEASWLVELRVKLAHMRERLSSHMKLQQEEHTKQMAHFAERKAILEAEKQQMEKKMADLNAHI